MCRAALKLLGGGLAILMAVLSYGISRSFSQMVASGLEREAMAKDMAGFSETLRAKNIQLREARKQLADLAKLDELTGSSQSTGGPTGLSIRRLVARNVAAARLPSLWPMLITLKRTTTRTVTQQAMTS